MNFGRFLKEARIAQGLTLRQCCERVKVDPSNWSKLERGIQPAPKNPAIITSWATALGLNAEAAQQLVDLAALSRKELPADLASDERVLAALPAFFRAARGAELSETELRSFIEDVRNLNSPAASR